MTVVALAVGSSVNENLLRGPTPVEHRVHRSRGSQGRLRQQMKW